MRILFLSDFAYNKSGTFAGTERFVFGLAEWLNSNTKMKAEILTPDWLQEKGSPKFHSETVNGVPIHFFRTHGIREKNFLRAGKRILDYVHAASKIEGKFDCYHGFSTLSAIIAGIVLAKRKKAKSVTTIFVRENIEAKLNSIMKPFVVKMLKQSDYITHNFWVNEQHFREKYNFSKNIATIPVWIDPHIKPKKASKGKNKIILHVGRLVEEKGVFVLLEAFAMLKKRIKNAKLVFVGPEYEKERAIAKIKELGLEKSVELAGFVSEKELAEWYNKADVFVAPTIIKEGWTWTSIEAMASGKPGIVTEEIAIPAVKKRFQIVVEKKNPKQLAREIERVLKDKKLYKELSENSIDVIKRFFDKEKVMRQYVGVYGKVCGK